MSAYGSLRHVGELEKATVKRLRDLMPQYVQEVERQDGREPGKLPALKSIIRVSEFDRFPEDQLPCAVVVCTGTTGRPAKNSEGYYRATYSVAVAIVTSSSGQQASRDLTQLYMAAVKGCLLQNRSLNSVVSVTDWVSEDFTDLPIDDRRTLFAGQTLFEMELRDVVSWLKEPPVEPIGAGVTIQNVNVTTEEITG